MTVIQPSQPVLDCLVIGEELVPEISKPLNESGLSFDVIDMAKALEFAIQNRVDPDLIIVCQSRPGEYRNEDLATLQAHFPLAGWIALLGTWCEGEVRTGKPWPGYYRVYWHQFSGRLSDQSARNTLNILTQLPRTFELDDESIVRARAEDETEISSATILVRTQQREHFQAVAEACATWGISAFWYRATRFDHQGPKHFEVLSRSDEPQADPFHRQVIKAGEARDKVVGKVVSSPSRVVLWYADLERVAERKELQAFCKRDPDQAVVLIANFPRWTTVQIAMELGVKSVLSMPFLLSDLKSQIKSCLGLTLQDNV